jgi:hypothetical protein
MSSRDWMVDGKPVAGPPEKKEAPKAEPKAKPKAKKKAAPKKK